MFVVGLPAFLILVKLGFITETAYTLLLITVFNLAFLSTIVLIGIVVGAGVMNLDAILNTATKVRNLFVGGTRR